MAKGNNDYILRDRLQFDVSSGDVQTVYGRLDLSDYVNAVEKKGMSIKEIHFQPHFPAGAGINANTGAWVTPVSTAMSGSAVTTYGGLKVFATTRAYQNAIDVGIGSPDILALEEWSYRQYVEGGAVNAVTLEFFHNRYGPKDLHKDGMTVISDLLIGIAADNLHGLAEGQTIELDIVVVASVQTVSAKELTEMLTQAQDL